MASSGTDLAEMEYNIPTFVLLVYNPMKIQNAFVTNEPFTSIKRAGPLKGSQPYYRAMFLQKTALENTCFKFFIIIAILLLSRNLKT